MFLYPPANVLKVTAIAGKIKRKPKIPNELVMKRLTRSKTSLASLEESTGLERVLQSPFEALLGFRARRARPLLCLHEGPRSIGFRFLAETFSPWARLKSQSSSLETNLRGKEDFVPILTEMTTQNSGHVVLHLLCDG